MSLYLAGAEASARSGNGANAAFGDCNVGELLSDQGNWDEAELLLRRARQVWRAMDYDWGVAYATAQLGRVAARDGRAGQALARLLEALAGFRELGVDGDVQFAQALLSEAAVLASAGRRDGSASRSMSVITDRHPARTSRMTERTFSSTTETAVRSK